MRSSVKKNNKPVSLWCWKHRAIIVAIGRLEDFGLNTITRKSLAQCLYKYGNGAKNMLWEILETLHHYGVIEKKESQHFGGRSTMKYRLCPHGRKIFEYWNPKMTDLETLMPTQKD